MCLQIVDKENKAIAEGYKVFFIAGGKLYCEDQGNLHKAMPPGEWLDEKDYRAPEYKRHKYIAACFSPRYKMGFHIYTTETGAENWERKGSGSSKVAKVHVRECHTSGWQGGHQVVVANKIRIPIDQ